MSATRFRWEDSVHAAYFRNPATSMMQLRSEFVARLDNADCWTLQSDFFDVYPEFEGDAPRYEGGPGGVRPSQRVLMRRMLEDAVECAVKKRRRKRKQGDGGCEGKPGEEVHEDRESMDPGHP